MEQDKPLTNINDLGEFGLIDRFLKTVEIQLPSTVKAGGDDAAVMDYKNELTVMSTDMYVEGVHFDMMYTPLKHLGFKCISGAVSDIYAMNAIARHVVVSLAISSKFTVEALDEIYKGIYFACKHFNVDLVGGDTTSSKSGLVINVTATGSAPKEKLVYRDGAKKGDLLCVSGDLGGAYIGLQILEREKRIYMEQPEMQPDLSGFDYVLQRQLRPEARKDIVELLQQLDVQPTAMIDISDGLASETLHICKASGTGCRIYEEKIPLDDNTRNTAIKLNLDPTLCALSGGEDYELLFTIRQDDHEKIRNVPELTIIGHITDEEEGSKLVTKSNNEYELIAQGWKHF